MSSSVSKGTPSPALPTSDPPAASRPLLISSSVSGASFLILLQLLSRLLTFGVNQLLLRYLSPEVLGVSTQLELYSTSVLFFSRESLRIALQRRGADEASNSYDDTKGKPTAANRAGVTAESTKAPHSDTAASTTQTIINLAYIPFAVGIPVSLLLSTLYLRTSPAMVLSTPHFRRSLHIYTIAALFELLTEPSFILLQHQLRYKTRAGIESLATVSRCVFTCFFAVLAARFSQSVGVLPFAAGQVAYTIFLLFGYLYQSDLTAIVPRRITSAHSSYLLNLFSRPLLSLATTFTLQSFLKHLLTTGDTLLITLLSSLADQGTYALASNYGSLIARLLFQPVEESVRTLFSRLLTPPTTRRSLHSALDILHLLFHFYALLSLLIISLMPTAFPLLLRLLTGGDRWQQAYPALSAFSYYIPLLAVNGLLESFVASVANESELRRQSAAMVTFSGAFALAGWFFLRILHLGARGLVAANAVNMLLRIYWAYRFLHRWTAAHALSGGADDKTPTPQQSTPRHASIIAAVTGGLLIRRLESSFFTGSMMDIAKAGVVALTEGLAILWFERQYLMGCYALFRSSADTSSSSLLKAD